MFSISVITVDSYQSQPLAGLDVTFSDFRGADIRHVPVIRIFGSTCTGIKTCLHVHGVFPYMYVPCIIEDNGDSFMYRLASAIDSAINVSLGSAMSNTQHVYKIQRVSGIPLYGYHEKEYMYFKIYFYNPAMIKRVADLFYNGAIFNQSLQPHEVHIPFTLQFMMDYNLYGMSLINVKRVKYRQNIHISPEETSRGETFNVSNVEDQLPISIARQSMCDLEVDAQAINILNKLEIARGLDLNPGVAAIWHEEKVRRNAAGLPQPSSQLLYPDSQMERCFAPTDSDLYQEERMRERLRIISQSDESTMSLNTSVSSYPLEAQNTEHLLSASYVMDHYKRLDKENKKDIITNDTPLYLGSIVLSQAVQCSDKETDTSLLDTSDMELVDILAHLANTHETEKIIDDDSVLGSQYSENQNQIKENENEEDEIEDLNITSLDLDDLSSWASSGHDNSHLKESDIHVQNNDENSDLPETDLNTTPASNLLQCDGANDILPVCVETSLVQTAAPESKTEIRKCYEQEKYKCFQCFQSNCKMYHIYQLDHNDLDVYDPDIEKEIEDTHMNIIQEKAAFSTTILAPKIQNKAKASKVCNEFILYPHIPAYDGAGSASDSEPDPDITIDRQEKRICAYKSGTKSELRLTIDATPKKRLLNFDQSDLQSPSKRRQVNSPVSQRGLCHSPGRLKTLKSTPRTYSPLDICITSPKSSKNGVAKRDLQDVELCHSNSNPSVMCNTSKHNIEIQGSVFSKSNSANIFRESPNKLRQGEQTSKRHCLDRTFCITQSSQTTIGNGLQSCEQNMEVSPVKKGTSLKEGKEVRKKLNFLIFDKQELDSSETSAIDDDHAVIRKLDHVEILMRPTGADKTVFSSSNEHIEKDIFHTFSAASNINFINYTESIDKFIENRNLPDVSSENDDTLLVESMNSTLKVPEVVHPNSDPEEDTCNLTFTQYVNTKSELNSQNSVLRKNSDVEKKPITIIAKLKPPSSERIIETMDLYNISRCQHRAPFFSDKADLAKHKENTNKKTSIILDVAPFKSRMKNITGITLWRRMKVNEFHPSGSSIKSCQIKRALAGCQPIVIQPLIPPPTTKVVTDWLRAKHYLLKKEIQGYTNQNKKKSAILYHSDKKLNAVQSDNLLCQNFLLPTTDTNTSNVVSDTIKESPYAQRSVNKDSDEASCRDQHLNNSECSDTYSISIDSSLQKALENPLLYKATKAQQNLGMSYGQIEGCSKGSYSNVSDENLQKARVVTVHQYLTLFSMEIHVTTRGALLPDPQHDPIAVLFYAIQRDAPGFSQVEQTEHGAVIVSCLENNPKTINIHSSSVMCRLTYVKSEKDLLIHLINLIKQCDPDILVGWEIESLSWGYLFHRSSHLGINNFPLQISKIPYVEKPSKGNVLDKDSSIETRVPGRIVLDVWRILRHEAALLNYTFENVMYHIMHERLSSPTFATLTNWWKHKMLMIRWRVLTHYVTRVLGTLRILAQLDIIGRTCELARLFGIQFYEVFSRGSQFRVESMMLRLAKPLNYIPVSPSIHQRARMRAPEALPLIMEPESVFYTDPLIVLDFQSLYPSIIIAHNYCFSTCLGRTEFIGQYDPFEFGATSLRVRKGTALKLHNRINFAPCGVAFVKSEVRQGILPRMLMEILNTRLMVKESIKLHSSDNHVLQRALHSQQLGLKLIANVTYGYTSANFSGRMPCIEIGDSVVSKGRETLERAIKLVESTPKWGARVVYGDTDSLFILLPGKSKKEAFEVGAEIANAVTADNPSPVKLKFEKVLQPSILQTKKRYCGYMYESVDQEKPEYLAKGIETVRRDGCPAVSKILEKSLKILFDTKDLSMVKSYVVRQFDKILRKRVSIQDLTFAKEFRGLHGYKPNACVPALELTRRLMRSDPRAIPRTGERVRYIIVAGAPNQPLIQCVRTPMEVILDRGLNPNFIYYITKVIIPPLNRCLSLIDIDINIWYKEMCHRQYFGKAVSLDKENQKYTIYQFFSTISCAVCGEQTKGEICASCMSQPNNALITLHEKLRWLERSYHELNSICRSCSGHLDEPKCESLDCPVLYRKAQASNELVQIPYLNGIIKNGAPIQKIAKHF